MNEPGPNQNHPDRPDPEESIDSARKCIYCHSQLVHIFLRPFSLCTPCMYELADLLGEDLSNPLDNN
jgi:hypothetical protein